MTGREYLALGIAGSVVIGLCVLAFGIPGSGDSGGFATYTPPPARDLLAQAKTETADPTDSPEPTDTPSPRPTTYAQYMREQKREFLAQVNESISGAMIAGNRFKYVGKAVDLHCTVNDIPGRAWFNASCGEDEDGSPVTIVIEYETHDLAPGQSVRVLGTVDQPMEGVNGFGGESTFPTVRAEFME